MKRPRLRTLLKFLLLLVAGAAVNVAVAWSGLHQIKSDPKWWMWDYLTIAYECHGDARAMASTFWCGTPCRVIAGSTPPGQFNNPLWRIEWPGFAINTVFYAAICWPLFAAPFAVRRRRRVKRGLCPACAYPVGTSSLCTECGKPVTPR